MFTKHRKHVGKYKFISSQALFLPERFNNKKKGMKHHEIYLRYIRDLQKCQDYPICLFLDWFSTSKRQNCVYAFRSLYCYFWRLSVQLDFKIFDVNSIVAFGFVQFPAWIRINVLTANLLK